MIIRQVSWCVLVAVGLLSFGCSGESEPQSSSRDAGQPNQNEYSKNLSDAKTGITDALTAVGEAQHIVKGSTPRQSATPRTAASPGASARTESPPPPPPPIASVLEPINKAIRKLTPIDGFLELLSTALATRADASNAQQALGETRTGVSAALDNLTKLQKALAAEQDSADQPTLKGDLLNRVSGDLAQASTSLSAASKVAQTIRIPSDLAPATFLSEWGTTLAAVGGAIVVLIILFALNMFLLRSAKAAFDTSVAELLPRSLSGISKQQKDLLNQFSALASAQGELGTRLSDIQTEVRSLGRLVRDTALDGGMRGSSARVSSQTNQTPQKDEPAFPISAGDYLEQMRRFSIVVKPDFQNGILVDDPEGRGELVLIRDSRMPDDIQPLFVIPRATQFQTKQDFLTYFEKYYDCQRPTAGEVWIIEPAVVSTVPGGWQLREKGVLEVR